MSQFLTEDFLLETEFARRLYHDYAKDQPIYDYHCHLPPEQIAEDYRFKNLYDIWLKGDHYKWRAMRTNGVAERFCTGDACDKEKFEAWAATVPHTIGNPLYHWTHLELRRPFGITGKLLSPKTAEEIWQRGNELLAQPEFSARGIMQQMNVKMVGTTDDPIDDLRHHKTIDADSSFTIKVLPSWRPDKAFNIEAAGFNDYIKLLEAAADTSISQFSDLCDALKNAWIILPLTVARYLIMRWMLWSTAKLTKQPSMIFWRVVWLVARQLRKKWLSLKRRSCCSCPVNIIVVNGYSSITLVLCAIIIAACLIWLAQILVLTQLMINRWHNRCLACWMPKDWVMHCLKPSFTV